MRQIILGLLTLFATQATGQKLYRGTALFDNQKVNAFSIYFKSDINPFIKKLQSDFGLGEIYKNEGTGSSGLKWTGLEKKEWSDGKLSFRLYAFNLPDNVVVWISCVDDKGTDLLTPKSPTLKVIENYLKEKLKD